MFPSIGLENALHVKVHNNPNLREFPGPMAFPRVKSLALSYAYHCCPFLDPQYKPTYASEDNSLTEAIIFTSHDVNHDIWAQGGPFGEESSQFPSLFLPLY